MRSYAFVNVRLQPAHGTNGDELGATMIEVTTTPRSTVTPRKRLSVWRERELYTAVEPFPWSPDVARRWFSGQR